MQARERRWQTILADSSKWVRLAVDANGCIGGFVHFGVDRDGGPASVGEVCSVYVNPEQWGSGCGSVLLAHAFQALFESGFSECTLWVLEGNELARRFYEREGMAVDGARQSQMIAGLSVEEIRYRRDLVSP